MKRLAIIIAGVFIIGTAAIAQNHSNGCATKLKGLTTQQIEKINQLEEKHQKVMEDLQTERRSTANTMEKDKIRAKMLEQKDMHHQQLKEVLTAKQWSEFESLHQTGNGYGRRDAAFNNGYGQGQQRHGHGLGQRQGEGQGRWVGRGRGLNSRTQNNKNCIQHNSNTTNVDTSQYHTDNFKSINL